MNVSVVNERVIIWQCDEVLNEIYRRCEDESMFVVKRWVAKSQIENEIEDLINLHNRCIAAPIGFVFPSASEV
jgi:hypothetical protein